ncbi:hypothetical protein ABFV43_15110 [Pseudomonas fulva]|jgi:hypothetical protein|uniref:hypothetical protein n=1 Tax=unclassified Pseudomonas TaxID=196821 RepID=UPI001F14CFF9|nr:MULTISPECIES: hypothetical protein [Pseudomonas]UNT13583.1 hypothetical protein MOP87_21345 [Pseudomonas sp. I3-I5]WKU95789.1 hypothetical protein Q3407_24130 [Pseudomonas fulva]
MGMRVGLDHFAKFVVNFFGLIRVSCWAAIQERLPGVSGIVPLDTTMLFSLNDIEIVGYWTLAAFNDTGAFELAEHAQYCGAWVTGLGWAHNSQCKRGGQQYLS